MTPLPEPTITEQCGSYAGYQAHLRRNEETCRDCKDAQTRYMREWRAMGRRSDTGQRLPLVDVRGLITDFNGVGAVVARGLRESA